MRMTDMEDDFDMPADWSASKTDQENKPLLHVSSAYLNYPPTSSPCSPPVPRPTDVKPEAWPAPSIGFGVESRISMLPPGPSRAPSVHDESASDGEEHPIKPSSAILSSGPSTPSPSRLPPVTPTPSPSRVPPGTPKPSPCKPSGTATPIGALPSGPGTPKPSACSGTATPIAPLPSGPCTPVPICPSTPRPGPAASPGGADEEVEAPAEKQSCLDGEPLDEVPMPTCALDVLRLTDGERAPINSRTHRAAYMRFTRCAHNAQRMPQDLVQRWKGGPYPGTICSKSGWRWGRT
jgi:hypothetical protein